MSWPKLRENGAYLAFFSLFQFQFYRFFNMICIANLYLSIQMLSIVFLYRHPETAEGTRQKKTFEIA